MKINDRGFGEKVSLTPTRAIGTTLKGLLAFSVFFLGLGRSAAAEGWDNQLFSAGIGSSLGGSHVAGPLGTSVSGFSSELSIRVHALYVLGLDFAYAPADNGMTSEGLTFGNALRLSALLYVVPTQWASLYAKVGVEASGFGGLFDWSASGNAFHLGGGVEVPITENWYVGGEFLMLIPGVDSVTGHASKSLESQMNLMRGGLSAAGATPSQAAPGISDYVDGNNYRLSASVRYYF